MKILRFFAIFLAITFAMTTGFAYAGPTTEVTVYSVSSDGETVLEQKTVDYLWMESNLPVMGDGVTHYYHQGPVFSDDKEEQWDVNETRNFKDRGAVKGTNVADLCDLVGGMSESDDVMVRANDGYNVLFDYENICEPSPRQGPLVLCWYNGEDAESGEKQGVGYPPEFFAGMRLAFLADNSTNPQGLHVFGNTDMRESFPAEKIHLFDNLYPSTSGYTVKWVDEIRVYKGGYKGETNAPSKSLSNDLKNENNEKTDMSAPLSPLTIIFAITGFVLSVHLIRRE
ncbi:argininosuccinate synthase [Methanoplanus sp. FWC-SCC4]|uniref:Argininosuccinate synthase n=1 Tax=Methanochimaera problematica TaxID=2609417 RepID=A0AA97I345_9EURY|nr:argininosuccinate synthase [Methanoplanus sp. FWC-SCC4]WOF16965.1 argininosuccinate synthase [Methanoplanus sp. FWC-SCC4]